MSGRAGRRGLDDKGIVIAMLSKAYEASDIKAILRVSVCVFATLISFI